MLHPALRAARDAVIEDAGKNVVPEVWAVLDNIKTFTGEGGRQQGLGLPLLRCTHVHVRTRRGQICCCTGCRAHG